MALIFVYITNPSKAVARKIAFRLINKKLAACAVITSSVNSLYLWKGKIADEKEYILIAKTDSRYWQRIVSEVEKIHPYSVPCIAKIPAKANEKYENWLKGALKN